MKIEFTNSLKNGTTILCYGPTGCGKTAMIATAPKPIVLSCDKGLATLRTTQTPFVEIRSEKDFVEALNALEKSGDQFQTICVDDITELAEMILREQKPIHKDARQAYGEMQDRILSHVRRLRDLKSGHNVYIIAKQDRIKDFSGGLIYGPNMPGQNLSQLLPHLVDEVYFYQVWTDPADNQTKRALRTFQDSQYCGKSRCQAIAPFEYPDLNHVFSKLRG